MNCYSFSTAVAASILIGIAYRFVEFQRQYISPSSRGHIIVVTHRDLFAINHAVRMLAEEYGIYVLMGVQSKEMVHFLSKDAVKGVELIEVDTTEPSNVAKLVYRSREIIRDLDRPLVGLLMLYPDGTIHSGTVFNDTLASAEKSLDLRVLHKSWSKAFVNPMRIIVGALPLLADPEENGGRIVILQPSQYLIKSHKYDDYIAHAAFTLGMEAVRSDCLESQNVSLSIITSTIDEFRNPSKNSDMTRSILHALVSPFPRSNYDVGAVQIFDGNGYVSVSIPLMWWRTVTEILPKWAVDILKSQKKMKTSVQGTSKSTKRNKKSSATKKKRPKRIDPKSTYEHLAMKFKL